MIYKSQAKPPADKKSLLIDALEREASIGEFTARIEALALARHRGWRVEPQARQLFAEVRQCFGEQHRITLRAERHLILAGKHDRPAELTSQHLADLALRCRIHLGDDTYDTKITQTVAVQFSRYSGSPSWRKEYQQQITSTEESLGKNSRQASVKRSNYAAALNEWGLSDEDRQHSYRIASQEWKWREATYGAEDPFVYVAAANTLSVALRAHQYTKPLMDARIMLAQSRVVHERRLHLLGEDSEATINSFLTLQSVRAELGHLNARWLLLSVVGTDHEIQIGPSFAERIPIALSRAFALANDAPSAQTWLGTARDILIRNYGADAPRTTGAVEFLERSIAALTPSPIRHQ